MEKLKSPMAGFMNPFKKYVGDTKAQNRKVMLRFMLLFILLFTLCTEIDIREAELIARVVGAR